MTGWALRKEELMSIQSPKLTHFTFGVTDLDLSLDFYSRWFGLVVIYDKRPLGSRGAWVTTRAQAELHPPDFVFVIYETDEPTRADHFGFQVETRAELDGLAESAKAEGVWIKGPVDIGGPVGSFLTLCDPSGHRWEFTWSQPLGGL